MEITTKDKPLEDTTSTSFSQQPQETVEIKQQRPPSRGGETVTLKMENKASKNFYSVENGNKTVVNFEHPALLTTHTPVKYSTESAYNRIIGSTVVRQHSPHHIPTITVTQPSTLNSSGSKFYHPVSTTTTVHQPITMLPHSVSPAIRSPTVVQVSPIVEIDMSRRNCCEHKKSELEKLQTMNDFLVENYTLVYGKLKEIEKQNAALVKPAPLPVRCIDEALFMREARNQLDLLYQDELQTAISKLRNMSTVLPQFKRMTRANQ